MSHEITLTNFHQQQIWENQITSMKVARYTAINPREFS